VLPRPRGRKPWALLALVLASSGAVPRCRAQDLLFSDAEDPQAALRWALSQARRATGGAVQIGGDPLRCRLVGDTCVDVLDVLAGRAPTRWPAAEAGLPLLEGAEPDAAGFGTWLLGRRQALQDAAAELPRRRARPHSLAGRTAVRDLVQLGGRLLDGGAATDGARILAEAVGRARALGDDAVLADALAHYGSAVVHAIASSHRGAAAALREAVAVAARAGDRASAALALRELGFVAAAAGDLHGGLRLLDRAQDAAQDLPDQLAGVHYVRGFALIDAGRSAAALHELDTAVRLAERAERPQQLAAALAMRVRARLQRNEDDLAAADAAAARTLVTALGWTALRPWLDVLQADVLLRSGRIGEAEELLRDARTLAEVLRDDCWLALTGRGLAAVEERRGRPDVAVAELSAAAETFDTSTDLCRWINLSVRDTLCAAAREADPSTLRVHAAQLATLAERTGLVEFAVRAALHRARAGDRDAAAEARARSAEQDNPALTALARRA
jgi:tetratricopeptide (TPR) repeat protein